jgi:hypothetical protein
VNAASKYTGINQDRAYLRGEVEFFEDDTWEAVPFELREQAMEAFRTLRKSRETTGDPFRDINPDPDHLRLASFLLAAEVDDVHFQSRLLRSRSEIQRLKNSSISSKSTSKIGNMPHA